MEKDGWLVVKFKIIDFFTCSSWAMFFFLFVRKSGSVVGWNSRKKKCLFLPFTNSHVWILRMMLPMDVLNGDRMRNNTQKNKVSSFGFFRALPFFHLITVNYDPLLLLVVVHGSWNFMENFLCLGTKIFESILMDECVF